MLVVICGNLSGFDMTTFCTRIRKSFRGQTATEYVLLGAAHRSISIQHLHDRDWSYLLIPAVWATAITVASVSCAAWRPEWAG
jgi:hypothetical protein